LGEVKQDLHYWALTVGRLNLRIKEAALANLVAHGFDEKTVEVAEKVSILE
jgi:hypothetical protein